MATKNTFSCLPRTTKNWWLLWRILWKTRAVLWLRWLWVHRLVSNFSGQGHPTRWRDWFWSNASGCHEHNCWYHLINTSIWKFCSMVDFWKTIYDKYTFFWAAWTAVLGLRNLNINIKTIKILYGNFWNYRETKC